MKKERSNVLYKALSQPWVYKLTEEILSPGNRKNINHKIMKTIETFSAAELYLDIGCGPRSWLNDLGFRTIGLDISFSYIEDYIHFDNCGIVASATNLPFMNDSFDAVWTVGLLHHINDLMYEQACLEMLQVCRHKGYIAILDAVYPRSFWIRPIPALLRKLDRGRYVRNQNHFISLISKTGDWCIERFTYANNGLEAVFALKIKER